MLSGSEALHGGEGCGFEVLLGMGTNLLYESFPGNYSTWDLNMEAVGSRCLPCNDDKTLKSELHYNGALPPPALHRQLGSDKEELRQTILKQEVMFNDQVQELHRLYRRQMELMNEIEKKQLHKQSDYAVKMSQEPRDLDSISTRPNSLIDLNQPYQGEEAGTSNSVYSLGPGISQGEIPGRDPSAKTNSGFGVLSMESFGKVKLKQTWMHAQGRRSIHLLPMKLGIIEAHWSIFSYHQFQLGGGQDIIWSGVQ